MLGSPLTPRGLRPLLGPLCGLVMLALVGCATPLPRPDLAAPAPPDQLTSDLLQRVERQATAYRALEGLAKVRVSSQGQTYNATQVVLVEQPDRLRAETLSPFGTALLVLATDGRQVTALIPGEGVFYQGAASPANLQRFTRLPLLLEDLIGLLLYQVPLVEAREHKLSRDGEGNLRLLLSGADGIDQELTFNGAHMLTSAAFLRQQELQMRVSYRDFSGDGTGYPTKVRLEMPVVQTEATLEFSEVRLNGSIPATRFRQTPPAGIEVRALPAE